MIRILYDGQTVYRHGHWTAQYKSCLGKICVYMGDSFIVSQESEAEAIAWINARS